MRKINREEAITFVIVDTRVVARGKEDVSHLRYTAKHFHCDSDGWAFDPYIDGASSPEEITEKVRRFFPNAEETAAVTEARHELDEAHSSGGIEDIWCTLDYLVGKFDLDNEDREELLSHYDSRCS